MTANWRSTNSPNVIWIDTHRVTLAEYEADVSYHSDELGQGRNAKNPVPAFSMYAGEPEFTEADNKLRATVWRIYSLVIAAMVIAAIVSVAVR